MSATSVEATLGEFALIDRLLSRQTISRSDVTIAAGDDCAAVSNPSDQQQILTTDTLIAGRHFLPDMPAWQIGHRALAVNLSDLAAMGAEPAWVLCSLNLPGNLATADFIDGFADGFFALAEQHHVQLIGGNMTQANTLSIGITAMGHTPTPITRDGAQPDDYIFVSGELGAAAAGLAQMLAANPPLRETDNPLINAYTQPTPQIALGLALRGLASSLIDCSDGFAQDVCHLMQQSRCHALIDASQLPRPAAFASMDSREAMHHLLNGGDDYQLIGTCAKADFPAVMQAAREITVPIRLVGAVTQKAAPETTAADLIRWNNTLGVPLSGWDHFTAPTTGY